MNKSQGMVRCANCGTEFADNFCPRCGQKAGVGRITWKTVQQGVMMLWGMDSRSLSATLLQLILRPGYLISDYISGKRQVSFPPVKMLVIVTVGYVLIEHFMEMIYHKQVQTVSEEEFFILDSYVKWSENNQGWGMLVLTSFFLFPTWVLFRHAPRNDRHTLPEGFFIQVFMSTLVMLVDALCVIFSSDWILWLLLVYFFVAYRQLFGYGLWGTLWRMAVGACQAVIIVFMLLYTSELFLRHHAVGNHGLEYELFIMGYTTFIYVASSIIVDLINKYTEKKRLAKVVP